MTRSSLFSPFRFYDVSHAPTTFSSGLICQVHQGGDRFDPTIPVEEQMAHLAAGGAPTKKVDRRTLPLPTGDGKEIPYRFGRAPVIGKEAAKVKDWRKIAAPIEERNKGKRLPRRIGRFIGHRDGVEAVYEAGTGWTANFMFSYLEQGTRRAERKIVVQGILKHYKVPHLPLRTDSKALLLAREGITLQKSLSPGAKPVGLFIIETAPFQDCLEKLKETTRYPVSPDEVWEEFRARFARQHGRRPTKEDLQTVVLEGLEILFGSPVRMELEAFLGKIHEVEKNKVLMEEARERGYVYFPGNSLIYYEGARTCWADNIYFDPEGSPGKRFFLYSW